MSCSQVPRSAGTGLQLLAQPVRERTSGMSEEAAGRSVGVPAGMLRLPLPREGRKRCLTCGTRAVLRVHVCLGWVPAVGRVGRREEALAGLVAASYLSLARRERVQNLRPCSLRTARRGSAPGAADSLPGR